MTRVAALITAMLLGFIAWAPSASAAGAVTTDATLIRTDVLALTEDYVREYGREVSPVERRSLMNMRREARSELNTLVRLVRRAEDSGRKSEWRRAQRHYTAMRVTGDQRLEEVRGIVQPHMSFSEQLSAWTKARAVLQGLDSLGRKIEQRAR